jgi:hypothetical protein
MLMRRPLTLLSLSVSFAGPYQMVLCIGDGLAFGCHRQGQASSTIIVGECTPDMNIDIKLLHEDYVRSLSFILLPRCQVTRVVWWREEISDTSTYVSVSS